MVDSLAKDENGWGGYPKGYEDSIVISKDISWAEIREWADIGIETTLGTYPKSVFVQIRKNGVLHAATLKGNRYQLACRLGPTFNIFAEYDDWSESISKCHNPSCKSVFFPRHPNVDNRCIDCLFNCIYPDCSTP